MKTKIITPAQRLDINFGRMVDDCLEFGTVRLLGINWKKFWRAYTDMKTGNLVFEYQ